MIVQLFNASSYRLPSIDGPSGGVVNTDDIQQEFSNPEDLKRYLIAKIEGMTPEALAFNTQRTDDTYASNLEWAVAVDAHRGVYLRHRNGSLGWTPAVSPEILKFEKDFFFSTEDALGTPVSPESFFISKPELQQQIKPLIVTLRAAGKDVPLNIGAWLVNKAVGQLDIEEVVSGYDMALKDLVNSYKVARCPSVAGIAPNTSLEIDVDALREYLELARPEMMDINFNQPKP